MNIDIEKAEKIIKKHAAEKGALIPLLQDMQTEYGYIRADAVKLIAEKLDIPSVEIYEVITFYAQFRTEPPGKHTIKVCQGTACHVMGGKQILNYILTTLKVKENGTTTDGLFSPERVACLGCCGMAPAIMIDNDFYGNCTIQKVDEILDGYRKKTG
ncbi:MAG: NADH-quinone oxidoreductase subunit NuoE [Elusimicrobia bacterium HGW-Elusimicrobia-2]|nr:MAG: NADH-quinone oxidoreductase subunit NuoE [Elusimicrobia bacterium HGW-Elusimicrobia-2]